MFRRQAQAISQLPQKGMQRPCHRCAIVKAALQSILCTNTHHDLFPEPCTVSCSMYTCRCDYYLYQVLMNDGRSLATNLAACLQSLTQLRLKEEKDGKEAVSTCNFTAQAWLHLSNRWLSALLVKAAKCLSKPPTSFKKDYLMRLSLQQYCHNCSSISCLPMSQSSCDNAFGTVNRTDTNPTAIHTLCHVNTQ